jgi:hypothetical protein
MLVGGLTAGMLVGFGSPAQAASGAAAVPDKCANKVPAQYLERPSTAVASKPDPVAEADEARIKAQNPDTSPRPAAMTEVERAQKVAVAGRAKPAGCSATTGGSVPAGGMTPDNFGPGYGYLGWMYHYDQITNGWCGEATIEEMSATVPGSSPIGLSQTTIANFFQPGRSGSTGTSVDEMVNGLNNYVGRPDFGFNFYHFIGMDGSPTTDQRNAFLSDLQLDVDTYSSPVAGDAYEVTNHNHLVGHPNQNIMHWFAIGGWDTNQGQIWYTDSAHSVWTSVPPYSWYSTYNAETIMGGRGYVW